MFDGLTSEYVSRQEQAYREKVVYPAASRRAQLDRELRALRAADGEWDIRQSVIRRLGETLVRMGARLTGPTATPARGH